MYGGFGIHVFPQGSARFVRLTVDLWYTPCVLAPLLACVASPAWYLALVDAQPLSVAGAAGILAAGWVPWLMALLGTLALADRYELNRHPRGHSEADAWDAFAVRWLTVTGAIGILLSLGLVGILMSVA